MMLHQNEDEGSSSKQTKPNAEGDLDLDSVPRDTISGSLCFHSQISPVFVSIMSGTLSIIRCWRLI